MQYKDVLDDLINILDRHKMIQTWGYGNLTDLVSPFKKKDVTPRDNSATNVARDVYNIDYPYAFLQPITHNLQKGKSVFNFNLIMMDQCNDGPYDVIQTQSNCYQYIQDVLAEIYYNYDQKFDFTLNSSVTPFKEKYDDTVSGMTANISIEIPMILDDCLAPFRPKYDNLYLYVGRNEEQTLDPDGGTDNIVLAGQKFINPDNQWDANRFYPNATRTYRVELEGYIKVVSGTGDRAPLMSIAKVPSGGPVGQTLADTYTGWPTSVDDTEYQRFKVQWNAVELLGTDAYDFLALFDRPGSDEWTLNLKEVSIKFYLQ